MKLKSRGQPLDILQCQTAILRSPPGHPGRGFAIEKLGNCEAGHRAELAIERFMEEVLGDYLQYLRLEGRPGQFFQLDTTHIGPHSIQIIETKAHSGEVHLDQKLNQMVQYKNGAFVRAYDNPINQASEQRRKLLQFLAANGFGDIPVEFLVAFANPATRIVAMNKPELVHKYAVHFHSLAGRLEQLMAKHKHRPEISDARREALVDLLISSHREDLFDVLGKIGMKPGDLQRGPYCENCNRFSVRYKNYRWRCMLCGCVCTNAAQQAVHHHFYLIDSQITNQQCRGFLQNDSPSQSRRLLQSLDLETSGVSSSTVYHSPYTYTDHFIEKIRKARG